MINSLKNILSTLFSYVKFYICNLYFKTDFTFLLNSLKNILSILFSYVKFYICNLYFKINFAFLFLRHWINNIVFIHLICFLLLLLLLLFRTKQNAILEICFVRVKRFPVLYIRKCLKPFMRNAQLRTFWSAYFSLSKQS